MTKAGFKAVRKTRRYTLSPAALEQRRALARSRMVGNEPRKFATVRIERSIRDDAAALCRDGESLATFVGGATQREVVRRRKTKGDN